MGQDEAVRSGAKQLWEQKLTHAKARIIAEAILDLTARIIGTSNILVGNGWGAAIANLGWLRFHNSTLLSLSAFVITDTELNVIAALAIIGLRSRSKKGYNTPAAIGIPTTL